MLQLRSSTYYQKEYWEKPPTAYERGRCSYKLLIYMAAGVPSISSPVGETNLIVNHKMNGLLANSTTEWISNLIMCTTKFLSFQMLKM
jgi:hypothetical protein